MATHSNSGTPQGDGRVRVVEPDGHSPVVRVDTAHVETTRVQPVAVAQPVPVAQPVMRPMPMMPHHEDVTVNMPRDAVRWGPIFAGLIAALTTMFLLNLLGLALGLSSINAAGVARGAADAGDAARAGTMTAIWAALSGIVGFFVGGYLAGKSAAVHNKGAGALNGALVFMLAVPLTLWLASSGLGALLGSLGNLTGALNVNPAQLQHGAQSALESARDAAGNLSRSDAVRAAQAAKAGAQTAAWSTLIGSLLALGAAALGGTMGAKSHHDDGHNGR